MRTTLDLDEQAVRAAMRKSRGMTKTAVVNQALREFARRRTLAELRAFRGRVSWQGDLDRLRRRRR